MSILPQLIYLALGLLGLGYTVAKQGEPMQVSLGLNLTSTLIAWALLYWGGFFDPLLR